MGLLPQATPENVIMIDVIVSPNSSHPKSKNLEKVLRHPQKSALSIYIYIYAVKLLTGPRLAILIVTNWATLIVTNWATSFSHYKNRGFR